MFTKKDRKIANLETRIKNRDILIENQDIKIIRQKNKIDELEKLNKELSEENVTVYEESKELKCAILRIESLVSSYEFGKTNPYMLIRDIKNELNAPENCI